VLARPARLLLLVLARAARLLLLVLARPARLLVLARPARLLVPARPARLLVLARRRALPTPRVLQQAPKRARSFSRSPRRCLRRRRCGRRQWTFWHWLSAGL